jgi:D-lyxose ketol-isomerase
MITISDKIIKKSQARTVKMLKKAGIVLTEKEKGNIEVCDYNLNDHARIGTQIVIYENNDRYCAKELIMFPHQICPEHIHPRIGDYPGKRETFRCRWGEVYLYVSGTPSPNPKAVVPAERKAHYRVWHEVILKPGEQYTIMEGVPHWFQGGPDGAIITEFSSQSFDDKDIFTDPDIQRVSNIQ